MMGLLLLLVALVARVSHAPQRRVRRKLLPYAGLEKIQ